MLSGYDFTTLNSNDKVYTLVAVVSDLIVVEQRIMP